MFGQIKDNYFVVGPNETGNAVCQRNQNRKCIGFTSRDINLCKIAHPNAGTTTIMDGSSSPFYCDGPPSQGACSSRRNTCAICPACNVNADCSWAPLPSQFKEMFVECGPAEIIAPPPKVEIKPPEPLPLPPMVEYSTPPPSAPAISTPMIIGAFAVMGILGVVIAMKSKKQPSYPGYPPGYRRRANRN